MSVIAEAFSVVVPNSVAKRLHPRGLEGIAPIDAVDTLCTDGVLSRIGFLNRRDADYFLGVLEGEGLVVYERDVFVDCALIDQNRGVLAPCLWVEFGRERGGAPVAWHTAARRGVMHAPRGWEQRHALSEPRFSGRSFGDQVQPLRREANRDWYVDRASVKVFSTQPAFRWH